MLVHLKSFSLKQKVQNNFQQILLLLSSITKTQIIVTVLF